MFWSKNKKAQIPDEAADLENKERGSASEGVSLQTAVLHRYMAKNAFLKFQDVEKGVFRTTLATSVLYGLSLLFCVAGVMNIWAKNSEVDVFVQRIDGVKLEVVNDARSKILLRKAIQNSLTKEQIEQLNLE